MKPLILLVIVHKLNKLTRGCFETDVISVVEGWDHTRLSENCEVETFIIASRKHKNEKYASSLVLTQGRARWERGRHGLFLCHVCLRLVIAGATVFKRTESFKIVCLIDTGILAL